MEHGLENNTFYVKNSYDTFEVCSGLPLVRENPLVAVAFFRLTYSVLFYG